MFVFSTAFKLLGAKTRVTKIRQLSNISDIVILQFLVLVSNLNFAFKNEIFVTGVKQKSLIGKTNRIEQNWIIDFIQYRLIL